MIQHIFHSKDFVVVYDESPTEAFSYLDIFNFPEDKLFHKIVDAKPKKVLSGDGFKKLTALSSALENMRWKTYTVLMDLNEKNICL